MRAKPAREPANAHSARLAACYGVVPSVVDPVKGDVPYRLKVWIVGRERAPVREYRRFAERFVFSRWIRIVFHEYPVHELVLHASQLEWQRVLRRIQLTLSPFLTLSSHRGM